MSRVCSVCGKGQTSGNNVSHSKRRTRRTFKANVQKVNYVNAEGKTVNGYVCTRCLKTVERAQSNFCSALYFFSFQNSTSK